MVKRDLIKSDFYLLIKKIQHYMERFVEHAEPNLLLAGIMGGVGFPLYYIVLHNLYPQPYENLPLRLLNSLICISWGSYRYMHDRLKRYFPIYFIISTFYVIPYYFSFMLLKNEFSTVWAMSTLGGLLLMTLLVYDWKYLCSMIIAGYGCAWLTVLFLDGKVSYTHFQEVYIYVYLFSVAGSIIATHKRQTINLVRMIFMRSLSGTIAHEMRNPLNAIVNAIEAVQSILPERPKPNSTEENFVISRNNLIAVNDVIDEASDIIRRGNKIIDSILTAMQGGETDTKTFRRRSAASTIRSAIDTFAYSAPEEKKLIQLATESDFDYFGDKDLLIYVLFNLIKNALYYKNKPSFSIAITTVPLPTGNLIRVRDTGPGVPIGKRELIFESFYTHGKSGGNGLGLSFCRRVINAFGGHIVCHSKEQEWTEFEIMLPVYDSEKVLHLKKEILKHKEVLLVDDDAVRRQTAAALFIDLNCRPDEAEGGEEALKKAAVKAYDLILMDDSMPPLNGEDAAEMLRSGINLPPNLCQHYRDIPIIGLHESLAAGTDNMPDHPAVNRYFLQPLSRSALDELLESFFFSEMPLRNQTLPVDLAGIRILIADDNATNRKFLRVVLEYSGCKVVEAEHGLAAIEKLEQAEFDIVLIDIEMPVMGGIEAVSLIRGGTVFHRFKRFREIPVIALTGHTDRESVEGIMKSGVNAHLSKPVAKKELISTISLWLQRNQWPRGEMLPQTAGSPLQERNEPALLDRKTVDMLKETLGCDMYIEILDLFIRDSMTLLEKLADAGRLKDRRELESLSHSLKGSSGTVGAIALGRLSGAFNEGVKADMITDIGQQVAELQAAFRDTVAQIEELKKELSWGAGTSADLPAA